MAQREIATVVTKFEIQHVDGAYVTEWETLDEAIAQAIELRTLTGTDYIIVEVTDTTVQEWRTVYEVGKGTK